MLKTVVLLLLNIFVETDTFYFSGFFDEFLKEMHLFETLCNIINVLIVTFDQFIASLLNKSINLFSLSSVVYHSFHKNMKLLNCFQH